MKTHAVVAILAFLLVVLQSPALTQDRMSPDRRGRMMKQLNLTTEQQEQLNALGAEFRKGMVDQQAEIAKARIELVELLRADVPNQDELAGHLEAISALQSAAKTRALDHWFAVNAILTAEQQKVWKRGLLNFVDHRMAERPMRDARRGARERSRPSRPHQPHR
jgi:Spy/CpxP family protein refolding chaperone